MNLREISVVATRGIERMREFNGGANCTTHLFLSHLGRFGFGPAKKLYVRVGVVERPLLLLDIVTVGLPFDFEAYWRSDRRKHIILETAMSGFDAAASQISFDIDRVRTVFRALQATDLRNEGRWGKTVSSPSRKKRAWIHVDFDETFAEVALVVEDRDGRLLHKFLLGQTEPLVRFIIQKIGGIHWRGDACVAVHLSSGALLFDAP